MCLLGRGGCYIARYRDVRKTCKKKDEDKLHIVLKSCLLNELNINKWI